jgi:hypothetical protein
MVGQRDDLRCSEIICRMNVFPTVQRSRLFCFLSALLLFCQITCAVSFSLGQIAFARADAPTAAGDPADNLGNNTPRPPTEGSVREARTKLREVFAAEFTAATTAEKKRRLAETLAAESSKTSNPAEICALLDESGRLAIDAGDAELAFSSIDALGRKFSVDTFGTRFDALVKMAGKVAPSQAESLAETAISLASLAEEREDHTKVTKCLAVAAGLARKSKNQRLVQRVVQLGSEVRDRQKAAKETARLLDKLRTSPDDPDVCLEVGSHLCFENGDWQSGLPLLAKGSDETLARILRSERTVTGAAQAVAVADQWVAWGNQQKPAAKAGAYQRANEYYSKSLPSLNGLERAAVEKRMRALGDSASGKLARDKTGPKGIPDLVLWLDASDRSSFSSANGSTKTEEGGRVAIWRDLSGMGNDVVQPDAAKQPFYRDNAIELNGASSVALRNMITLPALTVAIVYEPSGGPSQNVLLSGMPDAATGWGVTQEANAGTLLSVWVEGRLPQLLVPPTQGRRVYIGSVSETGRLQVQLAGSSPEQREAGAKLPKRDLPLRIGSHSFEHHYKGFQGKIQSVVLYSRTLDPGETAKLIEWLCKRFP